jgi:hypothetical protein
MNYSVLQQNVLSSLEHEEAKKAFLRAQEQPSNDLFSYRAEKFAREVDQICSVLKPSLSVASEPFGSGEEVQNDLLDFTLKRHWHATFSKAA